MQISIISDKILSRNSIKKDVQHSEKRLPSFKSIYVEDNVRLGSIVFNNHTSDFLPKDSLLLNDIAARYPNQDCFIKKADNKFPCLEYREKPPEVNIFNSNSPNSYQHRINRNDKKYPCIPLILYPNSDINKYIGMLSTISFNPSLPYTVKAGYELHKILLDRQYKITDAIGQVSNVDLGGKSVQEKAHEIIEDAELAVVRYLLECANIALTDRVSQRQLYTSNLFKVESRLSAKRRIDLTTSTAKQPMISQSDLRTERTDICEMAMEEYPNTEENKIAIKELIDKMNANRELLE